MDRNKQTSVPRGPKSKITQQPPDLFIALGSKQSTSRDDNKRTTSLSKSSPSHISSGRDNERKRENSTSITSSAAKKLKVNLPGRSGIAGPLTPGGLSDRASSGVEPWECLASECDAESVLEVVMNHIHSGCIEKAIPYVLGSIRTLRSQRNKPCKILYNTVLLVCQLKPSIFTNEHLVNALLSCLRKETVNNQKGINKNTVYHQAIYVNVLLHAFSDVTNWPEAFVKLYVEDAVADRNWIDTPFCKPFVDNITTAFNTKHPPRSLICSESWSLSTTRDTSSPLTINAIDDDDANTEFKAMVETWNVKVYPRYTQSQEVVEVIVLEAIKEQLSRRQQPEAITKNFVKFLTTACGLVEIRVIAVSRIETWLHNHKLMKSAQELLAYLCYNCSASTQRDLEVVAQLSKLRLKNKPMVNYFNNCLKEMVISFPENLYPLLKYTIYNELSNARNTNNLFVVGAMFQVMPEASADAFADICFELLLNKDDYLRPLRALLKEINRVLRHDFNLLSIVHSLLRERKELANIIRESEFRERIFLSLADLVCMCMLLCVSPQVRDAASQSKRDVNVLQTFQTQVSNIQREAVTWLHDSALRVFRPSVSDFQHILHKVVFLEQAEHYHKVDSWPGENERNLYLRLASEVPLLQATLLRLLLIGISKEHPIGPNEIIEIIDQLIKRAANIIPDSSPPLVMDKIEIIDFFFNLCSYNYPENIVLPMGYLPPKLAISTLYWKSWLMLLIIAAHNPTTFGSLAWEKYPTLKMFMEMCITNHFLFPPPTMLTGDGTDDFHTKEQQILAVEKEKILEFETHLAAASTKMEITEQSSLLLPQLMELNPRGEARRPPPVVFEQLQNLNASHRMGHLLCRSRHPDFLLDIMSRQGGTAHMPWLAELVHSSEGALAHLPVQCLCEYLLSTAPTEKLTKHTQLLTHLRNVVNGPDTLNTTEVLEYLLRRLTSLHGSSRVQAIKGLTLILSPNDELEVSNVNIANTHWLTQYINHFPHLHLVRHILVQFLRQAIIIETNPMHVSNYIGFLCSQGVDDPLPDLLELILDLSSLIVERSSITSYILPGEGMKTLKSLISIFCIYLQRAREPSTDTYQWVESQEQVLVTWPNGEQCTLQILIVHAAIILLTYGPLDNYDHFNILLDMWFPLNEEHPKAFLVDTTDEALLVPDWLKLRMIRSNVERLVDAAVYKLEPPQLVLFIQSFGIPVISISKLLQTLDKATMTDLKLVVDSVLDKNYMIQLVEVQQKRGAVGGETFVRALETSSPLVEEDKTYNYLPPKKTIPENLLIKSCAIKKSNDADLTNLLNRIADSNYKGSKFDDVNNVIKILTSEMKVSTKIFDYLQGLQPTTLLTFLSNNSVILLFRLLFTKRNVNDKSIIVAEKILNILKDKDKSLTLLLKQFLNQEMETSSDFLKTNKSNEMEQSEILGEKLGKMLLDNVDVEKTGLIVDWLASVELEIANTGGQLQMNLLFSKRKLSFRPLLISILLQRATWTVLSNVLNYVLDNTGDRCPVSVLDFLTALTQSPKLWQGRDKAIPKHHHPEDVLYLTAQQAITLVKYVLEETKIDEEKWCNIMEMRLPLVLKSIQSNQLAVTKYLLQESVGNEKAQKLLLMLYMSLPSIGRFMLNFDINKFSTITYSSTYASAVDVISHTLLSALTSTNRTKEWHKKSQELELCARKLTAEHPNLVIRQLPMLAGSLKGRAQYDWNIIKTRGHLLLFGQILGLLELLEPIVFHQTEALCTLLDSFFLLLKYHGQLKELSSLLNRLVIFLQNWMIQDIQSALKYLQQYGQILNDLQLCQPCVRPLLSSVSIPNQDKNGPSEQHLVGTATPPIPEQLPSNWSTIISSLQSQDPLYGLQELEHITNKKSQFLTNIGQYLYNFMSCTNQQIRSIAVTLVIRLLKYKPKRCVEVLPVLLSCLNSNNADVIETILEKLPEFVVVMQEHGGVILSRVFQLGINSNTNAGVSISKSIALLSLQSAC